MSKEKHYTVDFGFKPHSLQQEIIDYLDGKVVSPVTGKPYRFFVAAIGRQWGKSWLAKYVLLERAINRRQTCQWVAPTIPTARDHWNDLITLIEQSGLPVKRLNRQAYEIYFYGGGSIRVRSAIEPDNLRGPSLDFIVLDEAAFFRNGTYVWNSVVQPMITASGGQVLFTSTPNGRNWFYDVFNYGQDANNHYYKSWSFPSYTSPYQDKELLEEIRKNTPALTWREEYLAEFLVDGGGVFSGVERASIVKALPGPVEGQEYVAGIDFGQNNDACTFTVIDKLRREQVAGYVWTNVGTARTINKIVNLLELWQPSVTHIEKNGIGEALYSLLVEVLSGGAMRDDIVDLINAAVEDDEDLTPLATVAGGHKLRAVHVNLEIKRSAIDRLAADIEYGRLFLLVETDDYAKVQLSEMSTYERKKTPSGENSYAAAKDCHDDTVAGLMLAYMGVPRPKKFRLPKKRKEEKGKNPFKRGRRNLHAKRRRIRSAD